MVGGEAVYFATATFGLQATRLEVPVAAVAARPVLADAELTNVADLAGKVVVVRRGSCPFYEKARRVQEAGAVAMIVIDDGQGVIPMGDADSAAGDVTIACVMFNDVDGDRLLLPDGEEEGCGTVPTVQLTYDSGNRALVATAEKGHEAVVGQLIAAGADVNKAGTDDGGATPLLQATDSNVVAARCRPQHTPPLRSDRRPPPSSTASVAMGGELILTRPCIVSIDNH